MKARDAVCGTVPTCSCTLTATGSGRWLCTADGLEVVDVPLDGASSAFFCSAVEQVCGSLLL